MRRYKLWGNQNAMVPDDEGEYMLYKDLRHIVSEDRRRIFNSINAYHHGAFIQDRVIHTSTLNEIIFGGPPIF